MTKRSSSQQHATTPRPMNHACRDVGHDWQLTTDETIRQCTRHDCRAVERLVYESWMPVASLPTQPETQHISDLYQQLSFWSATHHTERPLDLESMTILTREQRAHFARLEKEYYNLSSDRRVRRVR
jgi:hypothetical protein